MTRLGGETAMGVNLAWRGQLPLACRPPWAVLVPRFLGFCVIGEVGPNIFYTDRTWMTGKGIYRMVGTFPSYQMGGGGMNLTLFRVNTRRTGYMRQKQKTGKTVGETPCPLQKRNKIMAPNGMSLLEWGKGRGSPRRSERNVLKHKLTKIIIIE